MVGMNWLSLKRRSMLRMGLGPVHVDDAWVSLIFASRALCPLSMQDVASPAARDRAVVLRIEPPGTCRTPT
jgi:hypothetical protein